MRFIFARYRYLIPALAAAFLLTIHPSSAFSQSGGPETKGSFVERFFLSKFSRPPSARAYVPADVENLSPAERYAAVVRRLNEKGVILLTGSKPEDPLTRVEHITLTYLLAGGVPGKSFAAMKDFLKERRRNRCQRHRLHQSVPGRLHRHPGGSREPLENHGSRIGPIPRFGRNRFRRPPRASIRRRKHDNHR